MEPTSSVLTVNFPASLAPAPEDELGSKTSGTWRLQLTSGSMKQGLMHLREEILPLVACSGNSKINTLGSSPGLLFAPIWPEASKPKLDGGMELHVKTAMSQQSQKLPLPFRINTIAPLLAFAPSALALCCGMTLLSSYCWAITASELLTKCFPFSRVPSSFHNSEIQRGFFVIPAYQQENHGEHRWLV